MFVAIKNSNPNLEPAISQISRYLVTPEFKSQFLFDVENQHNEETRQIVQLSSHLFMVRHSEFAHVPNIPNEVHLSNYESYGLIDLLKLGTETNKTGLLYWFINARSKNVLATGNGIICSNSTDTKNPITLATPDSLWIAANSSSTVFAINSGSSHVVT